MALAASEMLTLSVWFAEGDGSVCRCIADVFCAAQAAETSFSAGRSCHCSSVLLCQLTLSIRSGFQVPTEQGA